MQFDDKFVGMSVTDDYFVINHYNKSFDLSEYTEVDLDYTLYFYSFDEFEHMIENLPRKKVKANVG